ncbi:MAG: hypothetical protein WA157_05565 [Rhodoferax ferrireducens]
MAIGLAIGLALRLSATFAMVAGATGAGVTLARTTAGAAVFADLAETIFLSVVTMMNCPL